MNDKEKEAFELFKEIENKQKEIDARKNELDYAAKILTDVQADKFKLRKEIEKLQSENAKLRECVEFYADYKNDNPDNDWNNDYARQVLKDIGEIK